MQLPPAGRIGDSERDGKTVPLTETNQGDIIFFDLKKGIEKDAVRERQQRETAVGCKRFLPEPEPATALEPPAERGFPP